MAKIKNKKNSNAEKVHNKKDKMKKVMNPFEVHINKEKMRVLGKKQKNDRGLPGVARAKAIQKRKHTLLKEYKVLNKSNKFTDRRIGEFNHTMTEDDKVMARFTAVRVKTHKKSIFNLADDEVLTHKGQTLSEIEKFDDPRSEDESEEEDRGNLDKDFVGDAHFGGGVLRKTGNEGAKSHKELIEQLIAESKKRKAEKQKTKEETLELTEKLDSEWKDLLPLVSKSKKARDEETEKAKIDEYDKVMRELRFEARGTVSDRLKSEDEIAKEEKEKLEQLEKERLERMRGFVEKEVKKPSHRSADDLDDDFVYESDTECTLSYGNEGKSNVKVDAEINGKKIDQSNNAAEDEEVEEEEAEEESEEEPETESEDDLSDLKADESESEEEKDENIKESDQPENNESEKIKKDLVELKEMMEKARKELPYTFNLPDSYEGLIEVFKDQSAHHQSVIIERMIKCNHPSLGKGNKEGLEMLFAYLLQYLNDIGTDCYNNTTTKSCFEKFSTLVPQIFDLAQLNKENAHKCVLEVLKEKHEKFKKHKKEYPGIELLLFLKLVSLLFPTSDFRHQVVTPTFVFIEQMLTKCKVRNKRDLSYGLFLCTLFLEYTTLSKRYSPATLNFLGGLLHMAIPKTGVKLIKVLPPFKPTCNDLVLLNNFSEETVNLKMEVTDLVDLEIDEEYKIRAFDLALKLLKAFGENLKDLPSCVEIFELVSKYLEQVFINNYPVEVRERFEELKSFLNKLKEDRKLEFIVLEAKKPKALRLYEPKIEEVYDGKRFKKQSKEKAERDKMLHKLKKEKKGALREIRRDQAFLGRVKITQRLQSDKERREKVKRIYAEAAMQQSELNALDRKKKKK